MSQPWKVFPRRIRSSRLTIYDPIEVGSELWVPSPELEAILGRALRGMDLSGLPLRTRSKRVKERVTKALGYPIPPTFKRTRPRFPGQCFDTYIQKSNNLQVWNEELSAIRRYVLIRVDDGYLITHVRAVTGETLALLDTTGTLTQKYQARLIIGDIPTELISSEDTTRVRDAFGTNTVTDFEHPPTSNPSAGCLLPIQNLYARLSGLVGIRLQNPGIDQERNRGGELHRRVCLSLERFNKNCSRMGNVLI